MLEPKVLKFLEMAERGELPEDCDYPTLACLVTSQVANGKLTERGKKDLSAHRYDTCHEVKHDCSCKQCNKPTSRNWHIERYIPATKETWHIVLSFATPQEAAEVIMVYPDELKHLRIIYKKQD